MKKIEENAKNYIKSINPYLFEDKTYNEYDLIQAFKAGAKYGARLSKEKDEAEIFLLTENYISSDVSLSLQCFGFNEVCRYAWRSGDIEIVNKRNSELDSKYYSCPTYEQVLKWLKSKFNARISVKESISGWYYTLYKKDSEIINKYRDYYSYYGDSNKALEKGIRMFMLLMNKEKKERKESLIMKATTNYKELSVLDIVKSSNKEITDIDVCQMCVKYNETTYHYIQLNFFSNDVEFYVEGANTDETKYLESLFNFDYNTFRTNQFIKDVINGNKLAINICNKPKCWVDICIDVSLYSKEEWKEALSSYFCDEDIEKYISEPNYQLIAECMFENDYVYSYYDGE